MIKLGRIALLVAYTSALPGCFLFRYELDYKLVNTETSVDPATGDITRTFHWRYENGKTTTTTDVIHKGEDNEQRRNERPKPELRFSEP